MSTLNWIGKDKVINHHIDVPFKVLEHSYGFNSGRQTNTETKSGNKIIHGDNLEALKSLLPEYEGRITIEKKLGYNGILKKNENEKRRRFREIYCTEIC
jgi:hypothetical protein